MAAEVGSAWVSILPQASGFGKKLRSEVDPEVDNAGKEGGKRFGGAFALAAGAVAAVGVGSFFKSAISGASDLNETATKIEAIFGKGSKAVQDFASGGAKHLGQSKQAILDASATFGTFGKAAGLGGGDLAKFSTGFASLSTDLASFNNTSPEQAVEAIGAALRGEAEPLRAYGVLLDDASMRQEAVKLGLIKTTKEALTPQNKVLAAQALIYKQTKDAQGDFERTSGGLANQQRILGAQFTDLKANIGQQLLPVVVRLATFANDVLMPGLRSLGGFIRDTLGPVFTTVKDAVLGFIGSFTGQGSEALDNFSGPTANRIIDAGARVREIFDTVVRVVRENFIPAMQSIAQFIREDVVPVVQSLAAFLVEHVIPTVARVATIVGETLRHGFEVLSEKIQENRPQIEAIGRVLRTLAEFIVDHIVPVVAKLSGFFAETLFDAIGKAIGIIGGIVRAIGAIKDAVTTTVNWIRDKFNDTVDFFRGLPEKISSAFHGAFDGLKNAFRSAVNFIIDGWNGLQFSIPGFDPPGPGPKFGGFTLGVPDIPRLADGGIVTAQPGGTLVRAGEAGQDEAIIPLDGRAMRLDRRDLDYLATALKLRLDGLAS